MLAFMELPAVIGFVAILGSPIFAIILGLMAMGRIEHSGGQLRGRGLAIGAIVLGILGLLMLPVLLFAGFAARKAPPASVMVTPMMPVSTAPTPVSTVALSAADAREIQAENAYRVLYGQVNSGPLLGKQSAQIKAIENFIDEYEDTSYAHAAWTALLLPLKPDAPAPAGPAVGALIKSAKEKVLSGNRDGAADDYARAAELTEDSTRASRYNARAYQLRKNQDPTKPQNIYPAEAPDVVVPPEILKQAELGDHFETIDGNMKKVGGKDTGASIDPETRASEAFEALQKRLAGELAADKKAQLAALEDFVTKFGDTIVSARARVQIQKMKTENTEVKAPAKADQSIGSRDF